MKRADNRFRPGDAEPAINVFYVIELKEKSLHQRVVTIIQSRETV